MVLSQEQTDVLVATVTDQITWDRFDPEDHQLLSQLVEGLGDTRGMVRLRIAETLGEIGEPTIPFLLKALANHENVVVRRASAKTLTLIADPVAVEPLIHALIHDPDTVVKGSTVAALARIGEASVKALLEILVSDESSESMKGHVSWALAFIGADARDLVFCEIDSASSTVRSAVLGVVSKVLQDEPDDPSVELLINALDDIDTYVRCEAAASLGNIKYRPAVSKLVSVLQHEDVLTRKAAALALMKIGDRTAIEPLTRLLDRESEDLIKPVIKLAIAQLERQFDEDD
jgi:bilin biosynthesis protein